MSLLRGPGRGFAAAAIIAVAAIIVAAVVVLLVLPGRPSVDELADAILTDGNDGTEGELWIGLVNEHIDHAGARCIAEVLHPSDVADDALRALVEHDTSYERSEELQWALAPLYGDLGACMGVGPEACAQEPASVVCPQDGPRSGGRSYIPHDHQPSPRSVGSSQIIPYMSWPSGEPSGEYQ